MRKIEKAPNWKGKYFHPGIELLSDQTFQLLVNRINDKYLYWDKVKYQKIPKKKSPRILWSAVKFSRMINSKSIKFGSYDFMYVLTDSVQKGLHQFDLNLGGQLGTQSVIPDEDKRRYLISSIMEEAIASSQIEGAVTTRKKAKEMLRKSKKPRTKSEQMIVNNYLTIQHIVEIQNEHLTEEKLLEIHKLITHQTLDDPKDEGAYRKNNDVNIVDVADGEIVHTPPDFKKVVKLMNNLFSFFNENGKSKFIHPIIKGCILHFMIGFIHPFVDGNGRTARALFYWYLLKKGYWLTEYLSISRLIVKSKTQYAMAFIHSEIDDNDLTYFINYKLKTLNLAFKGLQEYIQRKINEKKKLTSFQRIEGINERQAEILQWIYEEPDLMLSVKEIETRLTVSNQTARTDLIDLAAMGFLEIIQVNKKTKAFCKSDYFEQLI